MNSKDENLCEHRFEIVKLVAKAWLLIFYKRSEVAIAVCRLCGHSKIVGYAQMGDDE